ncbi:RL11 Family [Baboon cytomegalovirus]|nr:RL11 Family [Baboon cytomegalovirus]
MLLNVCAMINKKRHINCILYLYIICLLAIVCSYTSTIIISVKVGDNVTLQDTPLPGERPFQKTWYLNTRCSRDGIYYLTLGSQLCTIMYSPHTITSTNACKQFITYTCESDGLHLYNITTQTPKSYTLQKTTISGLAKTTYYFYLNITDKTRSKPTETTKRRTHPTTTPTKCTQVNQHLTHHTTKQHINGSMSLSNEEHALRLQSSNTATATPIIVTVSIVIVMTCFWYLYYRYKHRPIL